MRRSILISLTLICGVIGMSCNGDAGTGVEGTWQLTAISVTTSEGTVDIDNPGLGRLMLRNGQYSQVWMQSNRLYSAPPTNLEKIDAFDSFDASAGSYAYTDGRLTLTPQIARDPSGINESTTPSVTLNGNTIRRTRERPNTINRQELLTWTSTYTRVQ